jgi:sterol desaturase/sphingolipid hydroxylase (fatty acid hydroxylase superfamily)
MPTRGVVGIAILGIPMALAALQLFGADVGWAVLCTIALYATSYEVLHLCFHLPKKHPIAGLSLIRKLSRHHARHHDTKLMKKWNFNVTLPLWDWILRTIAPKNASENDSSDA